jgi:large subunit ribosomal protein L13
MKVRKNTDRKYHLFNAENKVLGRMATEIVRVLRGKNKINFTPNEDGGDFVVVVNSDRVKITGGKREGKIYHRFSGYPGGITSMTLEKQIEKDSRKVIQRAVYRMLPKNKLRDRMITRLLIYKDDKHNHKIEVKH